MSEVVLAIALVGACACVAFGVVRLGSAILSVRERRRSAAWRAEQLERDALRSLPKLTPGQLRAGDQAAYRG